MSRGFDESAPRTLFEGDVPVTFTGQLPETKRLSVQLTFDGSFNLRLTDETDLFFFYESHIDPESYADLKDSQSLDVTFGDFPASIADIVKEAANGTEYQLHITIDTVSRLVVLQRLKIKTVTLVELGIESGSDEAVRTWVHSRYQTARDELENVAEERRSLFAMLKIKDPSILKESRTGRK
jgi:hypothetical protein